MGAITWWTLIIEQKKAHGEDVASGISSTDIHSPCIVVTNLCDAVDEIIRWYPLHRIVFDPAIPPRPIKSKWSPYFSTLFWDTVQKLWGRTDMPHIFLDILGQLRPDIFQKKPQFFPPLQILCDTDATNAEQDTYRASEPLLGVVIQTRRGILWHLNINEKSPDWKKHMWAHFAKISPRIW